MALVLALADDGAHPPGGTQGAGKHVDVVAPSRGQRQEVPLGLLAGRVLDLDGRASLDTLARLAVWAQQVPPNLVGEPLVAPLVPEIADLVVESTGPDVGVLLEP